MKDNSNVQVDMIGKSDLRPTSLFVGRTLILFDEAILTKNEVLTFEH